jgi:signal transduction histidine kinase
MTADHSAGPKTSGALRWDEWRAAILIALGYYLGAKAGFALTLLPTPVSTLWPPNAILLAGLLLTPVRTWGAVFVAVFLAHVAVQVQGDVPIGMVLCWFISNSSEALVGAGVIRRFGRRPLAFDRFSQVVMFFLGAGLLAPFLSSFLDAGFVAWNDFGAGSYWEVWRVRFFANMLATLTIVPFITTTYYGASRLGHIRFAKGIEAGVAFGLLLAICWAVFVLGGPGTGTALVMLYAPFPLLVWAAVRFGPWGASASLLLYGGIAILGAVSGRGPFVDSSPRENALAIQLFLVISWIPVMSLAAIVQERVGAEQAVRRSEEQLGLALDAARLGRWDWDIAANQAVVSDRTKQMFDADPLDSGPATLEWFQRFIHPDDRVVVERILLDCIERHIPLEAEFRVVRRDGSTGWILSRGKTICDETGAAVRMVGVNVEVTDRKRAELQIQEQQRELAHLARVSVVGELSVAFAHELNQPLAAIMANAQAARRFLAHKPPDLRQVRDSLDAIAHDDRRAADVVTRVSALLRKDAARWEEVAINDVVTDVIQIARPDIISRDISLTTRLSPRLPPVSGDRVQLQQVLLNLVINGCDAMGAVAAGARRLSVSTSVDGDGAVRVAVSDNGTGVPSDQFERIFEPFVTSKPQGLGLGLAICRSIMNVHDGRLWVENNPHGGASFCFAIRPRSDGVMA